jgi:hypothetical protein
MFSFITIYLLKTVAKVIPFLEKQKSQIYLAHIQPVTNVAICLPQAGIPQIPAMTDAQNFFQPTNHTAKPEQLNVSPHNQQSRID